MKKKSKKLGIEIFGIERVKNSINKHRNEINIQKVRMDMKISKK